MLSVLQYIEIKVKCFTSFTFKQLAPHRKNAIASCIWRQVYALLDPSTSRTTIILCGLPAFKTEC